MWMALLEEGLSQMRRFKWIEWSVGWRWGGAEPRSGNGSLAL